LPPEPQTFTDPATGRLYHVDRATGQTVWADQPAPAWPPSQGHPQVQPTRASRRGHRLRNSLLIGASAILAAGVIGAAVNGGGQTTLAASPAADTTSTTASAGTKPAPAPKKTGTHAVQAQAGTTSQLNALRAARSYLELKGYSRKGLITQLSSEYADRFSTADATWAADRTGANWNEQAVRAGRAYLDM
jgi:hypothetical protein